MGKLISLKLYGEIEQGFQAVLEIGQVGKTPDVEIHGQLPPADELMQYFWQWQASYRALGQSRRIIKPKTVTLENSLVIRKRDCQQQAQQLQQAFNVWLRSPSFTSIREKWLEKVNPTESVQAMLRTETPAIWQLPWHQWDLLTRYPDIELGFSKLGYEEVLETVEHTETNPRTQGFHILAILGNSTGIDVSHDRRLLEQLPVQQLQFLVEPLRQELSQQLWSQPWDILFFAGHSQTEGETGRIYLNQTDSLTLDELKISLQQSVRRGLQLAIFNSCDGIGLAQELEQLQIPYMVLMRQPVPDRVAQIFLQDFLHFFANGQPFYRAVQQARQRLEGLEAEFPCATWLPMIWQNPAAKPFHWRTMPLQQERGFAQRFKEFCQKVVAVSLLVTGMTIGLRLTGLLQTAELWTFDQLVKARPNEPPDARLLVVQVREEDLRTYQFPIPDRVLAQLLQKLSAGNPAVIGLDIYRDLPQEPGNQALTQQFKQLDRLIGICKHDELDQAGTPPPPALPIAQIGFSDIVADPGDIVRRNLLYMEPESLSACQTNLSFGTTLALRYLEMKGITLEQTKADYLRLGKVIFHPLNPPANGYQRENGVDLAGHQILMNYRRSSGSINTIAQQVSLSDVINNRVDPSAIRDRIVLIGVTASSIKDEYNTPYGEKLRGLTIHAQMVSQLLSAVLDGRSLLWVWNPWGDSLWIGGWAMAGGIAVWWYRSGHVRGLMIGSGIIIIIGACYAILLIGGWVPLLPAVLSLALSSVGSSLLLPAKGRKV